MSIAAMYMHEADRLRDALASERAKREAAERERDELRAVLSEVQAERDAGKTWILHWRTQAANLERERNDAQAAELRQLKNVERLVAELQEARAVRVPLHVLYVLNAAMREWTRKYMPGTNGHIDATAAQKWIDALPREEGAK